MGAGVVALAWGRVSDPVAALAAEGRDLAADHRALGVQTARLRPGLPPLRLNTAGWLRVDAVTTPALTDGEALRRLVAVRLAAAVPPFRSTVRAFIAAYLAAVARRCPPPPTGAAVAQTVRHPGDRFFNALLPLPCAWLPDQEGGFVRADVAFWTGDDLFGILLCEPSAIVSGARRAFSEGAAPRTTRGWKPLLWPPALWATPGQIDSLLDGVIRSRHPGDGAGPVRNPMGSFPNLGAVNDRLFGATLAAD